MANEKRLIDAAALMERLKFKRKVSEPGLFRGLESAMAQVNKAHTVQAVEVVHARWLNAPTVAFTEECSVCGFCVSWDADGWLHKYNYCPNCGAKMDGGNEDV